MKSFYPIFLQTLIKKLDFDFYNNNNNTTTNKLLIIRIFIITLNDSKCNSKNIAKMHPIIIHNSIKYIIIFRLF